MSQTSCVVSQPFRLIDEAVLHPARELKAKHDHIAVGERVFKVFDATIRPSGRVGLEPGAGLKRFTALSESDGRMHGILYAGRAVALQWRWLGGEDWRSALEASPRDGT